MVEDLRARLIDTQKEKIALLEEKLCNLCEEKHPDDGRHEELKKKCEDLEHNNTSMCDVVEDLRVKLMKTQKEKIVLLEEKLCALCETEHVEDNRHEEAKKEAAPARGRQMNKTSNAARESTLDRVLNEVDSVVNSSAEQEELEMTIAHPKNGKNYRIICNTYQHAILSLFKDQDTLTYQQIEAAVGATDNEGFYRSIKHLCNPKIGVLNKEVKKPVFTP